MSRKLLTKLISFLLLSTINSSYSTEGDVMTLRPEETHTKNRKRERPTQRDSVVQSTQSSMQKKQKVSGERLTDPSLANMPTSGEENLKFLEITPEEQKEIISHFNQYAHLNKEHEEAASGLFNEFLLHFKESLKELDMKVLLDNNEVAIAFVNHYYSPQEKELLNLIQHKISEELLAEKSKEVIVNMVNYLENFSLADNPLFKATQMGHPIAQYWYAMLYTKPEFLQQSAAQGYKEALYQLALFYLYPIYWDQNSLSSNKNFAYILCKEAAIQGHEEAQFSFANAFLEDTYGIEKNEKKGEELLKLFSRNGNKIAERALAARQRIKDYS